MFLNLNLLGIPDGAFLFSVVVDLLSFESIDAVDWPEFPDLAPGQSFRTAQDKFAVQVDFDDGAEVLGILKLDFLVIADHPDVPGNNFSLEAVDAILWSELADLQAAKTVCGARDRRTVNDNFDGVGVMMVVLDRL
jgi:hypothetical protein